MHDGLFVWDVYWQLQCRQKLSIISWDKTKYNQSRVITAESNNFADKNNRVFWNSDSLSASNKIWKHVLYFRVKKSGCRAEWLFKVAGVKTNPSPVIIIIVAFHILIKQTVVGKVSLISLNEYGSFIFVLQNGERFISSARSDMALNVNSSTDIQVIAKSIEIIENWIFPVLPCESEKK